MSNQNVPALRLEGFSGEWDGSTIGSQAEIVMGQSPHGSSYNTKSAGEVLVQGNADLVDGWVTPRIWTTEPTRIAEPGTLIMSVRAPVGAVGKTRHRVVLGRGVAGIRGNEFIFQYLTKLEQDGYWSSKSSGSTFDSVNGTEIRATQISIPPTLEEQQAIGAVFTNLDAAINQRTLKHKALQQAKTALMQRMFPQEGQKVPELRLVGFSGEWEKTTLGELGTFRSGVGFPEREQSGTIGLPFYKVSDLSAPGNELQLQSANHYVTEGQIVRNHWTPVTAVPAILFAKVGAAVFLGRKRLVNSAFLLDNNLMAFALNTESWDVQFADTYLKTVDLTQFTQSGALPSLNARHLAEAEAIIPPTLEEQQAIGAVFTNLDQLIAAEAQYIASLKQAKTALLQRMFV